MFVVDSLGATGEVRTDAQPDVLRDVAADMTATWTAPR